MSSADLGHSTPDVKRGEMGGRVEPDLCLESGSLLSDDSGEDACNASGMPSPFARRSSSCLIDSTQFLNTCLAQSRGGMPPQMGTLSSLASMSSGM